LIPRFHLIPVVCLLRTKRYYIIAQTYDMELYTTRWRRLIGCFIFIGQFPPKSPIISGSFAERDQQLRAFYASSPPCTSSIYVHIHVYIYIYTYIPSRSHLIPVLCVRARVRMCVHACLRVYVCLCVGAHANVSAFLRVCASTCLRVSVSVCAHISNCLSHACIHVLNCSVFMKNLTC